MFEQLNTTHTTRKMQRLFLSFIFGMVTIIALALSANPQYQNVQPTQPSDQQWPAPALQSNRPTQTLSTHAVALATQPVVLTTQPVVLSE